MADHSILKALAQLSGEVGLLAARIAGLEEAVRMHEALVEAERASSIPGVRGELERLRMRFEHLRRGDVMLEWRAEVYAHDRELLEALREGDAFRAVVPPLDVDHYDDDDFTTFIEAQVDAADRGVRIERMYMFESTKEAKANLASAVFATHLKELAQQSRNISLSTVVSAEYSRKDFVLFGDGRCSKGREDVDRRKHARFEVLYTSNPKEVAKYVRIWDRLQRDAKGYKASQQT